jgi:DNA repair protein REV1
MQMRRARDICPGLEVLPYEFELYKKATDKFYHILARHTMGIQAVSIDEAYLDLTGEALCDYAPEASLPLAGDEHGDEAESQRPSPLEISSGESSSSRPAPPPQGVSDRGQGKPQIASDVVRRIRKEILDEVGICASAGIAPNMLLARMSTDVAKPNGQMYLVPEDIPGFMLTKRVKDLPGVGWSIGGRLKVSMPVRGCDLLCFRLSRNLSSFSPGNGH